MNINKICGLWQPVLMASNQLELWMDLGESNMHNFFQSDIWVVGKEKC